MSDDIYVIAVEGLADTRPLESLPQKILTAAARAINRTATRTRTRAAEQIRDEVAFQASYLNPSQGRLVVSKKANAESLEGVISARTRPTMLARFAGGGTPGKAGVTVEVAPGFAKYLKRAFLIRLPAGRGGDVETKSNLGVAIRLKEGEVIQNKRVMSRIRGNLYLLYGPSVDQVFKFVREDIGPETSGFLADEFSRLIKLDLPA